MVAKTATKSARKTAKSRAQSRTGPTAKTSTKAKAPFSMPEQFGFGDMSKMAKLMTPEQAFDLYRANARMALDVISTAIENTAKLRKLQFEGEEQARSMQKKAVRHAAEADDPQSLVAAGQHMTQEAVQQAMQYWSQMFEMIVEMQKRLFALMEAQTAGVPGAKEAKALMAMMPDFGPAKNLVTAMQDVMSSGGSTMASMQKVMGDFARMAQQSMPGGSKR